MINIYAFCDNNCKHLVYTREEVLSLLQQAINDGSLKNIDADYAAVKSVVDSNAGSDITFWTGTEAEFNALNPVPKVNHFIPRRGEDGKIYICIDDTSISNLPTTPYSADEIKAMCDGTYKAGKGNFVNNVGVAALWDKANDSFSVDRVGDIKTTLRTTLGDKWVLANGVAYDPDVYPKLAAILPEPTTFSSFYQSNIPAYYNGADYANGICVAAGVRASGDGSYYWVGSLDGLDSFKTLSSQNSYYHSVQYDKDNDLWVMAFCDAGGNAYSWATKDPVGGTWTSRAIPNMGGKYAHTYGYNGLWVAVGVQSSRNSSYEVTSSAWVSTTTDPINNMWSTPVQIGNRGASNPEYASVYCHDGVWVIATGYEESRSAGGGGGIVTYTTTDPVNGTWTMKTVDKNTQGWDVYGLHAHNGTWVMTVYNGFNCRTYTTKDPVNGTWVGLDFSSISYGGKTYNNPWFVSRSLRWHRGKWCTLAYYNSGSTPYLYLVSAENIGDEWDVISLSTGTGKSLCTDGKVLVAMATRGTSQNLAYYLAHRLPTITTDGAYTYIRAKE